MKTLKLSRTLVLLALATLGAATWLPAQPGPKKATEAQWLTDFAKAKELAAQEKRPILVNFSGSDWCGWCQRLDSEVLSKESFKEYANKNLVLFEADFPRTTKQPDALKMQNQALAKKYSVRGFPTLLLLDAQGNVLAQTGYQPGGPEKYVEHLKELLAKKAM